MYAEQGDAEVYGRIRDIAKSHQKIQNFIELTGFHARKSQTGKTKLTNGAYLYYNKIGFGGIETLLFIIYHM